MRARDRDRASTGYTGPALATQGQHWLHRASSGYTGPATLYRASYSLPGRDWIGTDTLPGTALAQAAELHGTRHTGTQATVRVRPLSPA